MGQQLSRFLLVASLGLAVHGGAAAASIAIEYYHGEYGHYFVTASPREIAVLNAGRLPGWSRTGESFGVLEIDTAGSANVCRFWSGQTFAPRSSHFFTPVAAECATVRHSPDWLFEGEAFGVWLPDADGNCAVGTLPLYRLYNDSQTRAPNHRYTTNFATRAQMLAQRWIAEGYGIGVIGCVPPSAAQEVVQGRVIDGHIEGALVCLDLDRDGRCGASEPQAYSDATGFYGLTIPVGAKAPLVAEVIAGQSRDSDQPQAMVDLSYRMASPSPTYSTDVTPYSTMVYLTGQGNYPLAENMVRDLLGLPPNFDIRMMPGGDPGSLKQSVAKSIVAALKARGLGLDLASRDALAAIVNAFPTALTDLPQVRITTKNGAPIDSKEVYVDATYVLTNPAAAVPDMALNGKIRGRGHSTWGQPKNPYKVQFSNDARYAAIADVLGMRKQRNWALLADYFDRSLIRNKLALSLGSSSVFSDGLKWTPSGQHVEVWLNDDYVGVYLLTEDIRIDPARLNIRKMSSKASDNEVDGGYIVEADVRLDCYNQGDLNLQLVTQRGAAICVDTPDEEAITAAQLSYIKNLLVEAENDLYGSGRLDRFNPTSFADWYLLQELFRNNDAVFFASDFMWKDTDGAADPRDRLLNMGPLWDFDRSAGNVNDNGNWKIEGCWVAKPLAASWIGRLFANPQFVALVLSRWNQKRPALEAYVNAGIDTFARRLAAAQQRNFERWPILGLPLTNHYDLSSYADELAFVRQFLNERMAWLDKAFATARAFDELCR